MSNKQQVKKFLWMRACIADSFGLKEDQVAEAIFGHGNEANRTKMEQFLETEGPPKIMVYYQPPDTGSQNDHNVIDPQLFLTYGDTERIKDKAVWFLRNLPENKKKININQGSNEEVLFGQVTPNPVRVLNYMIEYIYDPLINGEKHDWGQTDQDSKKEFVVQTQKFKKQVREALKLMEPGQEHFKIRPEELQRLQSMTQSQRIQRFEEKFDEWIKTIERFLSTEPEPKNEGLQPGPKTELQFWKQRMQTITNWSEQLKNKDFNMVKMSLIKYKQNEGNKQGQENINKLMLSFQRLDLALTDKLNEAKDNVKYLSTLQKFIEPLYTGTPQQIIETLPSLMNAIKMIHTIARFYNTSDKMTGLFIKITNQMIKNCREKIIPPGTKIEDVWKRDPAEVIEVLGSCIKLNREYKEAYKATKEKVADMPKGKTFDFSETQIFNKFDQFVKRLQKLIEVFSNIQQFDALAKLNLQKMDVIINKFNNIRDQFKAKRKSDLLDLTHSNFDKEYVSFNISISQLDTELQQFIDDNFSKSKSIEQSINLLKKFENTIKRDALKHNLTSKYNTILTNYASQLEVIQRVFNDQKSDPPIVRNMPENAGKIIWSKHLYQKIAGPITKFPQNVIHSSQIKKYYGNYNTLGKMLTINEMWYYDLWVKEIERSKAALQATLIVRHQTQKKLYVNFDVDIMQLIREAKCLDRQGIPIPESARIILLQEEKFKMYYNQLLYVLKEYERIISKIKPICKNLLAPHIADMELKLHPGMSTLTWTSMNIDSYLNHVHQGLNKLQQLIINVNDIIENRIQNNLKNISKVSLVSLPHQNVTFTLETFVSTQEEYINQKRNYLTSKNLEIERSVDDLLLIIINYQLDPRIDPVKSEEVKRIKKYYFFYMYNALLNATQNSLNSMKHRVCGSSKAGANTKLSPFFQVDVQLSGSQVQLNPSLEEIQKAINKAATAVLRCSKTLYNWDQHSTEDDKKQSLYEMIAQDKQIVKVILLLTGSIQGTKNKINEFISKFSKFQWLWQKSITKSIKEFSKGSQKPQLSAYESEFKKFSTTEEQIQKIEPTFIIGAMQLKTNSLIVGLKQYTKQWKNQYAEDLHKKAKAELYRLSDHISELIDKLSKTVVKDIDSLGIVMEKLEQIRSFQAVIDISFNPVTEMYALLDANLPGGITDKDQSDARIYLWSKWSTLIDLSEKIGRNLAVEQTQYLRTLKKDIKILVKDITDFRADYEKNGPMVEGIIPKEAIERLKRFDEQYEVRQHQFKINFKGEQLFGLQHQKYPALQKTKAQLLNLKKLYNLYSQVIRQINSFQEMLWVEVNVEKIAAMQEASKKYSEQCIKLPKDLKEWQAYKQLKTSIQNLKALLPVITILKKDAVKDRHWQALNQKTMQTTHHRIPYDQPQVFTIEDLVKAKVLDLIEDIQQIGQSAEKQKKIEINLGEITQYWSSKEFQFGNWGKRENIILGGLRVAEITQKLQEDQMVLSSTNAQRHVTPFKKQVEELIRRFSDTSQILDLWIKVQTLWRSLQPVFTGGDIAKQMPLQAKAFAGIDKTWMRCMQKSFQTKKVLQCCELDLLKDNLPDMQKRLEECQKLLEAYLQGKRKLFPRFYFVSNPDLLKILSQGSEPTSIQQDFEKLFDAITKVEFGKSDKKGSSDKTITTIIQEAGGSQKVPLVTHVKCQGNIESWLKSLQKEMQDTMREHCRNASATVMTQPLQAFVKSTLSQVSLMGIQLLWTHKITEALEKGQKQNKGAMQSKKKQIQKMLQQLTNLCLQPIETSLERTKIQTLVTVHVHQRDITVQMKCQNVYDFDWQKQTRLYWRSQQDTCMISITDWEQSYSYEFLGAKERLCITPLTDRCYITLAQAMSMYYGGAPAGPAGTGKTETVKDLGRGLGVFVVVTNCSDQHRYRDMAKIFKGLVQSGLWGCFDEFNRIELQVLSVVAMQVQSIGIAKKQHVSKFMFPEEQYPIDIVHSVGYFITMNPGYAGRQQLPENLKVLFRGVTMMMPDREIIIKVKLASVGYQFINVLAKKFNMLYKLCQEQLSKQRHYDFGLRNILSVLRTAGNTKRKQTKPDMVFTPQKKEFFEEFLLMRSLRDMNMSKLVFDDIALFEGLLKDIFPRQTSADKVNHAQVQSRIPDVIKKRPELINRPEFTLKIIQVYETSQVRHGFMLLGLSITGKTTILSILTQVLSEVPGRLTYRIIKMNPKAITDKEMYGVKSQISDDWIPGVFSTLWQKCNSRSSKFNIWLTCDGPVDAIWIENLNTVLDDNKILTLANGERIPMTDQCKLVFEVENLNNASPATVSRCGQIYISPNDLGTTALYEGWCQLRALERSNDQVNILKRLIKKYFQDIKIVQTLQKTIKNPPMMDVSLAMKIMNTLSLINGLLKSVSPGSKLSDLDYEKIVVYALSWAVGGLYEASERFQFHQFLQSKNAPLPSNKKENETIFDYYVLIQDQKVEYSLVKPEAWKPAADKAFKFSQLLLPTIDSFRVEFLINNILTQPHPTHSSTAFVQNGVLLIGGSGTAKTSSVLMWAQKFDLAVQLFKRINFSSATSPGLFQASIQQECDNKMGKEYGPPQNKLLAIFIDDLSMPFVNKWGDQVTLEIVRQLMQQGGFYWLDKAQRGNFKSIKNLSYVGAMNHPGGGRNDIPNRLKRQFFIFNMILPLSIEGIYGPIVRFQFRLDTKNHGFTDQVKKVIENLTSATIKLWQFVKKFMLPTPSKFHYLFNMRQLSRTFKGILQIKKQSIMRTEKVKDFKPELYAIGLWRYECQRVFCDKLVNNKDKDTVLNAINDISIESFGMQAEINQKFARDKFFAFADFLTPDEKDDEGIIVQLGPRNYEAVSEVQILRKRAYECMEDFNAQPKNTKKLQLVLFNDALKHLLKIIRIIRQPRSSGLLVGVGGSGKQSLTRLASFIQRMQYKQIQLVKNYAEKDLKQDIKKYFEITGRFGKNCCFILTDSQIKKEEFLQFVSMILSTGQIPGLLAKDEKETFLGDARNDYVKEFKGADPAPSQLYSYFVDRIRDNLHVCLCFSPVGQKFRDRFRKFPALFNECTIDWFLPWPEEALISVAESFIEKFKELDTEKETKVQLMKHMGNVHYLVTNICDVYFQRMRRQVYFTPKSYLSYLAAYKKLYTIKYKELDVQQSNFKIGVKKINEASEAIAGMKVILSEEELKLKDASEKTEKMLRDLQVEQRAAQKIEAEVNAVAQKCQRQAIAIDQQKTEAERQLAAALPAQARAQAAVDSLDAASVNEMKANKKPQQILKLVLDAIAIYFNLKLSPIVLIPDLEVAKGINIAFWKNSYEESGKFILGPQFDFLKNLKTYDKDAISNETIQLLEPLLISGVDWFNEVTCGKVSKAIAAICKWLYAVFQYHEKSQIVKPKKIKLAQQQANLQIAQQKLAKAREQLRIITEKLNKLKEDSQKQLDIKNELESQAQKTKKKITTAETLINSLSGERARWKKGANEISDEKKKLVGNCSLATAFISYCGPFNAEFRQILAIQKFTNDMKQKDIPHLPTLAYELTSFLVDQATVGQWNLQGLPKDSLSVQNGIMVTRSDRFPLLIDPQGQGQTWILRKYAQEMQKNRSICALTHPKFKDWFLKYCLENGKALLIEGIENQVDPILDPVLQKQIIWRKNRGTIKIAGGDMDYDKNFKMFLTCRLPNPSFSPQLSAKTTVIDFTVTQGGLQQQLLGKVISHEQKSLEDSLNALLNDVNANKKALQKLDKDLLQRLTQSQGNLLDDTSLMEVLNNTKTQAKEVAIKLEDAENKTKEINEKREQYRPVAIRGSALYFTLIELFLVNWMYNSSLEQFLQLFNYSLAQKSPQANSPQKRVDFIIKVMTRHVHKYVNRGLFEKDKITFLLMVCFKILITAKKLTGADVGAFLKAGAGQDIKTARQKPQGNQFNFIEQKSWLNIIAFSKHTFGQSSIPNFKELPDLIQKNQPGWLQFFQKNDPENYPIPDLAQRMSQQKQEMRAFMEMFLVRSVRQDRTLVASAKFIAAILGQQYIDPISYPMQDIWAQSKFNVPVLFLLSPGADPTSAIDDFARKKKKTTEKVSMGEGQQEPARKAIKACMQSGGWVILQNCQLGLKFMEQTEQMIIALNNPENQKPHEDFRLWITCQPHNRFPLGLLQKVIKVTNEPPKGLKAGLYKTFTTMINQQFLQKVDNPSWKNLIFTICYLHSVVIERRKFGSLGWCVPYEFNNSDLEASLCFVEKYLNNLAVSGPQQQTTMQQINTTVLKYMVCEVLYGGRITDDLDRELFATFGQQYIKDGILNSGEYVFFGNQSKDKNAFKYKMPANPALEISKYHEYINTIPAVDTPQVFGLDSNADLTFRMKESVDMISTIMQTRPKEASAGGGKTRQEIVKEKALDLLSKMPLDYNENEVRQLIKKLSGPKALGAVGYSVPLNIFLSQEIARMQVIFNIVRKTLVDACDAIDGQIIMTAEIMDSINAIFDARVPNQWVYDATGAQISWIIPTLAKWFNDLIQRNKQLYEWMKGSRPYTFWLGGFFNPQGFLTAMKQEVTRMHKTPKQLGGGVVQPPWSLDDVVYQTTVKQKDQDLIRQGRDKDTEGVFIRQLMLEGARWHKNSLQASRPKEMFAMLPILHVTAINKKKSGDDKSVYNCPVYKYAKRTDRYLIFRVTLNTESQAPSKWKLKGVALLCARD